RASLLGMPVPIAAGAAAALAALVVLTTVAVTAMNLARRARVKFSDRSPLTAGVRFRLTGPVSPVTGWNRTNANLNSNSPVETVLTGIPAGLTGNRSNSNFFLFL